MEFDLSSLTSTLNPTQRETLEKNLMESSFKKLVASEKLSQSDIETLKAKLDKLDLQSFGDLKVKFLAHLASIKEDYIWILLHLMKMRQDPKYSPAMLDAANNRDWPTLTHLCQN